jgi:aminopeptidase YwaD
MNIYKWALLAGALALQLNTLGQKLKKADRAIVANFRTHIENLKGDASSPNNILGEAEKANAEYVSRQFARYGLKPAGDSGTWFQRFTIYEGKELLPATMLKLNQAKLVVHKDYFPFAFSANKKTEAAVAIALAENGVPWFKELGELLDRGDDTSSVDTTELIRQKANAAAEKGASALVIYNAGNVPDLAYDGLNTKPELTIPVLYLSSEAFKKYCSDESAIIDISINVEKRVKTRIGTNVLGYLGNKADSTIIAAARLTNDSSLAALIEIARLTRQSKSKQKDYLFVALCGEQKGLAGISYFQHHAVVEKSIPSRMVQLDTVDVSNNNPKGLHLVRQSLSLIR